MNKDSTLDNKYYGQICQDDELNEKFNKFHVEIVNKIILFCKENNIEIDSFTLYADCLKDSIKAGEWEPCTDSSFEFNITPTDEIDLENYEPFLFSI